MWQVRVCWSDPHDETQGVGDDSYIHVDVKKKFIDFDNVRPYRVYMYVHVRVHSKSKDTIE